MKTTHPHLIATGHIIDKQTHKPAKLEDNIQTEESAFHTLGSPSVCLNYNPEHPQIIKYFNRWGK